MLIGIDASRAFFKERTGIEEYSYQVIKHLTDKLDGHQVVLYLRKNQEVGFALPEKWKVKTINFPYLWTQLGLSLEMILRRVDTLFVPSHVVPLIHPENTVVTIHGLEFEVYAKGYSLWERLYMRWSIKFSCRAAKKIIAVSKNTKKDLVEIYKIPEDKIEVVYEGVNKNYQFSIINSQSIYNDKISNLKHYFLFIGRLEKRKNVEGIIEAYNILKEKYNIPHDLVLAGAPGYGFEIIKLKIKNSLKIENCKLKIIELGYVDEILKWQLLSNADVFLYPTFYEGFGLPVLEAQNAGTPVVTSNVSSLPEVGVDSVAYCDPNEPVSIADGAYEIISNKEFRDGIIEKGYENVKRFSWDSCAEEIAKLLVA